MKYINRKLILFLLSAALTGLVYIFILYILREFLDWNPYLSVVLAYISAMSFYFICNKFVVFQENKNTHTKKTHRQIFQYSIIILINFIITMFLVWFFKKITGEVYSGSIAAGILTTVLAYLVFDRIF